MKAAIYVRVSTAGQAGEDKDSLPDQARELKALCAARGWQIADPTDFRGREALPAAVFGDPGITGDTLEGRHGMVALLEAVKSGGIGAVLVRDTNRLARHELAAQRIHAVLEQHHVLLVTPAMEYDYANLQHRLMLGLLGSIEAYAKRWLVMNMRRAREAKAARGEFAEALRPYGYQWCKLTKRPVIAKQEVEIVREAFRLAAEERLSSRQIAMQLRRRGVLTRGQAKKKQKQQADWANVKHGWYETQITDILQNPCYKGEWQTAPGVLAKDPPPPLIDAPTWAQVQALRAHHRKRTRRPPSQFLLSGMVFCAECGGMMTARCPQEGVRYYGCNRGVNSHTCVAKHVPASDLEQRAWGLVEELAADPEAVAVYAERTEREELPRWRRELKRTQKGLEDLDFEDDAARIAYRKGVDTLATYEKNVNELRQERAELTAGHERLTRLIEDEELREAASGRAQEIVREIAGRADTLTFDERRKVLQRLAFRVVVNADDWSKRRDRHYQVHFEWMGEAFMRAEGVLASMQGQS